MWYFVILFNGKPKATVFLAHVFEAVFRQDNRIDRMECADVDPAVAGFARIQERRAGSHRPRPYCFGPPVGCTLTSEESVGFAPNLILSLEVTPDPAIRQRLLEACDTLFGNLGSDKVDPPQVF